MAHGNSSAGKMVTGSQAQKEYAMFLITLMNSMKMLQSEFYTY
jgi:hypothetical protein